MVTNIVEGNKPQNVRNILRWVSSDCGLANTETWTFLCPQIRDGLLVHRRVGLDASGDLFIQIDNLDEVSKLSVVQRLVPEEIFTYFTKDPAYLQKVCQPMADGRRAVPFSRIIRDRVGQCLEMAILSQIGFQQRQVSSYLCGGRYSKSETELHAWNLTEAGESNLIWDVASGFVAPIRRLVVGDDRLKILPDYACAVGNRDIAEYCIGGE